LEYQSPHLGVLASALQKENEVAKREREAKDNPELQKL
jgi:hypothetical protein